MARSKKRIAGHLYDCKMSAWKKRQHRAARIAVRQLLHEFGEDADVINQAKPGDIWCSPVERLFYCPGYETK